MHEAPWKLSVVDSLQMCDLITELSTTYKMYLKWLEISFFRNLFSNIMKQTSEIVTSLLGHKQKRRKMQSSSCLPASYLESNQLSHFKMEEEKKQNFPT